MKKSLERICLLLHILVYMWKGAFYLKKWMMVLQAILFMGAASVCFYVGEHLLEHMKEAEETSGTAENACVVIDPGHGGPDSGKIGVNGLEEKTLNLDISLRLREILEQKGIRTVMTRQTEDRLKEDRVEDLKARVNIMNKEKPALAVSIHQNSFTDPSVFGAQVFYYEDSEEGKKAAEILQRSLNTLDPDNTKKIKANRTYYILKKTKVPVVIAECGFLSNYNEAEKLRTEEYRQLAAEALAEGIAEYISK